MARIGNLLRKDIVLGIKDVFVILEVVFAILVMVLIVLVVPDEINNETQVFLNDETEILTEFMDRMMAEFGIDAANDLGELYVDSREEVIAGVVDNPSAIGLVIAEGSSAPYSVELMSQPYTQPTLIDFVKVDMADVLSIITPPAGLYTPDVYQSVRVESLATGLRDEIPFNKRLMPLVLLFMIGIMGLFIMVSVLGQERADQTMRAFRVSPGGLWSFLASKHLLVVVTGAVTTSILYLPVIGTQGYLPSLIIMVLTILIGSSIGMILAAYFDNPMSSIGWVLLLILVFNLPTISLLAPIFSPGWLRLIPSYHTLFGLDAAMFPDNNANIIWTSIGVLGGVAAALYLVSGIVFGARIRKEN